MEVVNISKRKFKSLKSLALSESVVNTECELFHYKIHGRKMLVKKLYRYDDISFANKLYTIQAIEYNKNYIPEYFVRPEYFVAINRQIEAFLIPFCQGVNLSVILKDINIELDEKISYLKCIGKILEDMKNIRSYTPLNDFYLGDLHEDNFVIDRSTNFINIVDTDSIKIANNTPFPSRYLTVNSLANYISGKYKKREYNGIFDGYDIDENTDLYCYIIVILNFLYGENISNITLEEFYNYLNYLDSIKINSSLLDCFERIVSNNDNVNPMDYLDCLTTSQIGRARKIVYKYNK